MKPRHALALALVGWYLMAPPYGDTRPNIPLSEWVVEHVFDSAQECDEVYHRWRSINEKVAEAGTKPDPALDKLTVGEIWVYGQAECIASDDPRLKEK